MCCGGSETLDLPAEVIEAIAGYRRLRSARGTDWGDDQVDFSRWAGFPRIAQVQARLADAGDWSSAVRAELADGIPSGTVVVRIGGAVTPGPSRPALDGERFRVHVVVDNDTGAAATVAIDGRDVPVDAGDVDLVVAESTDGTVTVDGRPVRVARTVPAATLRLTAPRCARWSVTDGSGSAWFPADALRKWDFHGRPFFHGDDVTVEVPAGQLTVACARGIEFDRTETSVTVAAGQTLTVPGDPPRLFDPAAHGWYGGDLHVHLNYSGDLVCTPQDAARMQHGEGLHLMNLVVGNFTTSLVYDRDLLETTVGRDLPWSDAGAVARAGVEYRNDMLGHVHALGPSATPSRFYAGHERSDHPDDWPPNAVACAELRDLGATVGYAHPSFTDFPDGSTDAFLAMPRTAEARELVADAALGLVDSVDLISPFNDEGAVFLYHRLLNCGLRLAATVGTDCFLSFSRLPNASNPPGWGRVYAQLGDAPLSVEAFQDAIRAGRTVATNGPWITLDVGGHGPGTVLDRAAGGRLSVRATVTGPGVDQLCLVGPDGVVSTVAGPAVAAGELRADLTVDCPTWIAAVARGAGHPHTLDAAVLAHTTPVYVDVAGAGVARAADARWCLDLLDALEGLVTEHGHFHPDTRAERLGDVTDVLEQASAYYRTISAAQR